MKENPVTLLAVHAHPDDEASTTGGILAKYSAQGVRTVLVTCTNGEMGDAQNGAKPGEAGHDEAAVVAVRRRELELSCSILGVRHLELLGFRDSGMMGWESNDNPESFWQTPVPEAAGPLAALIERYAPQVVVTYDDFGFYGHPDHIQAHRITLAALEMTGSNARLFFPTVRRSRLDEFTSRLAEVGMEPPDIDRERFGSPDEEIAATIDCSVFASTKREALQAHASQSDNTFFLRMPLDRFVEFFGTEEFVRGDSETSGAPLADLFAGIPGK
jgi:LmbE family N-acetylglucosaminyl deacetylase